jgi:Rrf2 family protein
MRLGEGVEWALHSCTILALLPPATSLPAGRLAEFHGVPAAYLAKHLQQLAGAGIVESTAGRRGGYRLARPASEITFAEVVEAVEGHERAFRCSEIRQRGPAAVARAKYSPVCGIARVMYEAERAWRDVLADKTVQDAVDEMTRDAVPESGAKALRWFQEVLS